MVGLLDYAIIPAGPGDADELARVHVRSRRETYPGQLPQSYLDGMNMPAHARRFRHELIQASPEAVVLLAEDAAGGAAYLAGAKLTAEARAADAEVYTLYVLRRAQGAGLGRALLSAAARVFAAGGARSLMLRALSSNAPARSFYEHLGGEAFAEIPSRGWGREVTETAYRWPDLGRLIA